MRYVMYKSGDEYRWRLVAANGRIIANSGESYKNRQDCLDAINLVKSSKDAPVDDQTRAQTALGRAW